jgi:hypothetical protein
MFQMFGNSLSNTPLEADLQTALDIDNVPILTAKKVTRVFILNEAVAYCDVCLFLQLEIATRLIPASTTLVEAVYCMAYLRAKVLCLPFVFGFVCALQCATILSALNPQY